MNNIITAEIRSILAAYIELDARREQGSADQLPVHSVTVTHPREVFADPDARKAAELVGRWGRKAGVRLVIDPHDGELPISLSDFGGSSHLRDLVFDGGGFAFAPGVLPGRTDRRW